MTPCAILGCSQPARQIPAQGLDTICVHHSAAVQARVRLDLALATANGSRITTAEEGFRLACVALAAEGLPLPRNAPESVREGVGRASRGGSA